MNCLMVGALAQLAKSSKYTILNGFLSLVLKEQKWRRKHIPIMEQQLSWIM